MFFPFVVLLSVGTRVLLAQALEGHSGHSSSVTTAPLVFEQLTLTNRTVSVLINGHHCHTRPSHQNQYLDNNLLLTGVREGQTQP